jgi:uncharacterized protein YajQ (UPF0234 family)
MISTSTQTVEYDGAYKINSKLKNGFEINIYSRGYQLKSWINFEKSLGAEVYFVAVSEEEFQQHQWYSIPFENLAPPKVKKKTTKTPAYPADDGPLTKSQIKQLKKTVPKPVKKAVKKAVKKPVAKAISGKKK